MTCFTGIGCYRMVYTTAMLPYLGLPPIYLLWNIVQTVHIKEK